MTLLTSPMVDLCRRAPMCQIATLCPDGMPHLTQTWVDTNGTDVLINTVVGYRKARNVSRDPRVALTMQLPENPSLYLALQGLVRAQTTDGGGEHINELAQRYLGRPYPYGHPGQQRLILTIEITRILQTPFPNQDPS
jgi:PPOX class probable F420-dependent enzyme